MVPRGLSVRAAGSSTAPATGLDAAGSDPAGDAGGVFDGLRVGVFAARAGLAPAGFAFFGEKFGVSE